MDASWSAGQQEAEMRIWQTRCEQLANENERLRSGLSSIQDRAKTLPHVVMRNGTPLENYCRSLLIGPTKLPEKPKTVASNEEAAQS